MIGSRSPDSAHEISYVQDMPGVHDNDKDVVGSYQHDGPNEHDPAWMVSRCGTRVRNIPLCTECQDAVVSKVM